LRHPSSTSRYAAADPMDKRVPVIELSHWLAQVLCFALPVPVQLNLFDEQHTLAVGVGALVEADVGENVGLVEVAAAPFRVFKHELRLIASNGSITT
jgi:hypothetical protein